MSKRRKKSRTKAARKPLQPRLTDGDKAIQAAIQNFPQVLAGRKATH